MLKKDTKKAKLRRVAVGKLRKAADDYVKQSQLMRATTITSPHTMADLQDPPPEPWDTDEVYQRVITWYTAYTYITEEQQAYQEFVDMHGRAAIAIAAYNQMTV